MPHQPPQRLQHTLRNGAMGFVLTDSGPQILVEAIRATANRDALTSSAVTAP